MNVVTAVVGIDFLKENEGVLNLHRNVVCLKGVKVPVTSGDHVVSEGKPAGVTSDFTNFNKRFYEASPTGQLLMERVTIACATKGCGIKWELSCSKTSAAKRHLCSLCLQSMMQAMQNEFLKETESYRTELASKTNEIEHLKNQIEKMDKERHVKCAVYPSESDAIVSTDAQEIPGENNNKGTETRKTKQQADDNDEKERKQKGEQQQKKKEIRKACRFFKKGHCKFGSKCVFLHPKKVCNRFLGGTCNKPSECVFLHPVICKDSRYHRTCLKSILRILPPERNETRNNINSDEQQC